MDFLKKIMSIVYIFLSKEDVVLKITFKRYSLEKELIM